MNAIRPCKKCGGTNIRLYDENCSSFNTGGGKCLDCGRTSTVSTLGCAPTKDTLTSVWNDGQLPTTQEKYDRMKSVVCSPAFKKLCDLARELPKELEARPSEDPLAVDLTDGGRWRLRANLEDKHPNHGMFVSGTGPSLYKQRAWMRLIVNLAAAVSAAQHDLKELEEA